MAHRTKAPVTRLSRASAHLDKAIALIEKQLGEDHFIVEDLLDLLVEVDDANEDYLEDRRLAKHYR